MSVIGTFAPSKDGGWSGTIRTLTINVRARIVPNDNRDNDRAPDFRVLVGQSEVGAAWRDHTSGEDRKEYLKIRLDDPSLPEPLSAAMFKADRGIGSLVWKRR